MLALGLALGIDFGTSGARAIVLDAAGQVVAQAQFLFAAGALAAPAAWRQMLWQLLSAIAPNIRSQISRIAINGTSATVLLCDRASVPITPALLYNDARARSALPQVQAFAPPDSPVLSATSSLVKALWWQQALDIDADIDADINARSRVSQLAHQADWLAALLHGRPPVSDYHNALKLGYDVRSLAYPDWLLNSPVAAWLPDVLAPGDAIAPILPTLADQFSFPRTCQICAGTTDSIAAFLASGVSQPGEAVTSLGSTLVLKLLSLQPIDHQSFGIYSHRLGDLWLIGGASNTGGAVLQQYFTPQQLAELSQKIDISLPCPVDYYPLSAPGERFPINDPDLSPRLTPRPERDQDFLYGLLNGIAQIEAEGYGKLNSFGAPALQRVHTAGGGAKNLTWQAIRQRWLGVPVLAAAQTAAAYGTAQLAVKGLSEFRRTST